MWINRETWQKALRLNRGMDIGDGAHGEEVSLKLEPLPGFTM